MLAVRLHKLKDFLAYGQMQGDGQSIFFTRLPSWDVQSSSSYQDNRKNGISSYALDLGKDGVKKKLLIKKWGKVHSK